MKKTLTPIIAAVTFLFVAPVALGQSSYFGQPSAQVPSGIYQPRMTAMSVFQADEGSVPIPADAGTLALPGTPANNPPAMSFQAAPDGALPLTSIPPGSGPTITSPDMSLPVYQENTTWNAFSPPGYSDPFLQPNYATPGSQMSPYGAQQGIPPQGMTAYGANGAQPYRFGWQNRVDVSWMPGRAVSAPVGGATGNQEIFGVDYELAYGTPFIPGWILNWTNQFSYRNWNGPDGGINIANDLYRFGLDFELETPQAGPFSISLGVTPSINTDFRADIMDEGFQLDGRGILFMQLDQYWTLGLGAMYWDRVDDRIIPWAGLIYRDDYWEWQLMYPEARVSVFLGNEAYWSKWLYVRAEYHVEAYGVESTFAGVTSDTQVEMEDYRVLAGLKMDGGTYNWFFEGGWVFNREVTFANATPGYDIGNGFIGQIGLRF